MPSLRRPGKYSRIGLVRKWWHVKVLHHSVAGTIVRDVRTIRRGAFDFYFRPGWVCVNCKSLWP